MKIRFLFLVLLVQVYHAPALGFNFSNLWRKAEQETITKEYPIDSKSIISISNTEGSVTIKPWNQQKLTIEATKKGTEDALKATTIACRASGAEASITTRVGHDQKSASVDYTIMVPEDATISISQTKGPVKIKGILGTADVSVQEGSIDIIDTTQTVSAKTGKGDIKVKQKKFDEPHSIFLESLNGNIVLHVPRETRASLNAKTGNGTIISDHPVTLAPITLKLNKTGWDRLKKEVEGSLGSKEGAPITLVASKGNITIKEY